jgi:uncharacterized protein (DUF1778 family)
VRATGTTTLSLRIPADVKNYLIDSADALDMSITEYLLSLVRRDAGDDGLGAS